MRISICDNEEIMLDYLKEKILLQYPGDEIDCYSSVSDFLNAENIIPYDLLLMDVVFDNDNGINAAAQYQSLHPNTRVIFVTAYGEKFAQDIFTNVTPSGYLFKPIDISRLFSLLMDVRSKVCTQTLRVLPIKESRIDINQNEILYIESDKRKIRIYTTRNTIECYEKLDDVEKRLSEFFIRCHKSYVVNLTKISSLDGRMFVLYNGIRIPISQVHYNDSRSAYFRLLGMYLQ